MSRQLFTPSPSPPPPVAIPTLPAQINAATRKQHVVLNRMIVDRLPQALPPNKESPLLYGHGLAAFAQIYFMFERLWSELALTAEDGVLSGTHDAQLRHWLASLHIDGLQRSRRLKSDLRHILDVAGTADCYEQAMSAQKLKRMEETIRSRPHILVAYGWVMYMAVFSGGRWIRQQLAKGGSGFWIGIGQHEFSELEKAHMLPHSPGFSFLSFDGYEDGEDIKMLFKARLAEAETLLTQQERQDIIAAARYLFDDCIALVRQLDHVVWWWKFWKMLPISMVVIGGLLVLFLLNKHIK